MKDRQPVHGVEVSDADTDDDDGEGQVGGGDDGLNGVDHVAYHPVCDYQQHVVDLVKDGRMEDEEMDGWRMKGWTDGG